MASCAAPHEGVQNGVTVFEHLDDRLVQEKRILVFVNFPFVLDRLDAKRITPDVTT